MIAVRPSSNAVLHPAAPCPHDRVDNVRSGLDEGRNARAATCQSPLTRVIGPPGLARCGAKPFRPHTRQTDTTARYQSGRFPRKISLDEYEDSTRKAISEHAIE
jgi:hypothetical protein